MACLQPLEFNECVIDSPEFRDKLSQHEKEIDLSSKLFKDIFLCIKNVYKALSDCSQSFKELSTVLKEYKSVEDKAFVHCAETEDEKSIKTAVQMYSEAIDSIETMRGEHILGATKDLIFEDMQKLKEDCISKSKNEIKEFKKTTSNYYQKLDKFAATKYKSDFDYTNIDIDMKDERIEFTKKALDYVENIQQTQEEKTFRLVHTLSLFIQMLNTYHHQAWDHFCDQKKKMDDVNCALFRTGENYREITNKTTKLKEQILSMPLEHVQKYSAYETSRREGYLFMLNKKNVVSDNWSRNFCIYEKSSKSFTVYSSTSIGKEQTSDKYKVVKVQRRSSNSIDRRFCFDISVENRSNSMTFQAVSKEDLGLWMTIMDGKEPVYAKPTGVFKPTDIETVLNEKGYKFLTMCISEIERRGLDCQGIYRTSGRVEVINKNLMQVSQELRATNSSSSEPIKSSEVAQLDVNSICSIVKSFLKYLPIPLATYELYPQFIGAGKIQEADKRLTEVSRIVKLLPKSNLSVLVLLINHLKKVSNQSSVNLMTPPNLGVCFSPTIFRADESYASLTAIRESKFAGDVITCMIEHSQVVFPSNQKYEFPTGQSLPNLISQSTAGYLPTKPVDIESRVTSPNRPTRLSPSKSVFVQKTPHNSNYHHLDPTQQTAETINPIYDVPNFNVIRNHDKTDNNSSYVTSNLKNINLKRTSTEIQKPSQSSVNPQPQPPPITHPKPDKVRYQASLHDNNVSKAKQPSPLLDTPKVTRPSPSPTSMSRHRNITPRTGLSNANSNSIVVQSYIGLGSPPSALNRQLTTKSADFSQVDYKTNLHNQLPSNIRRSTRRAKTLYMYIAEDETQLSFSANKLVNYVMETDDAGWLQGNIDGRCGLIPSSYVELLPM